jgi:hypothetical protein
LLSGFASAISGTGMSDWIAIPLQASLISYLRKPKTNLRKACSVNGPRRSEFSLQSKVLGSVPRFAIRRSRLGGQKL